MDTRDGAFVICLITCPEDHAARIAHAVVQARNAACVNVIPAVRSIYRWEGAVHEDAESLLVVKTTAGAVAGLEAQLNDVHPYDTFELVAVPIAAGNGKYLAWIRDSVGAG